MRDALCAAPESSSAIAEACPSVLARTSTRTPSGRESLATASGYLNTPDGMDFIPAGRNGQLDWTAVVHP